MKNQYIRIPIPETDDRVLILVTGDKYTLTLISEVAIEDDNTELLAMLIRKLTKSKGSTKS